MPRRFNSSAVSNSPGSPNVLVHPAIDGGLVLGGGALVSIVLYALWRFNAGFLIAATIFAICLDLPHVLQTTLRVWYDPQERALHRRRYVASLTVIFGVTATLTLRGHLSVVLIVWLIWQVFHVVKQHEGIVSLYLAKAGYRGDRRLTRYVLYLGCAAPVLYRLREGMAFADYVVFGHRMPFSNLAVATPSLPGVLVGVLYAAFAVCVVSLVIEQEIMRRAGKPMLPIMSLLTLCLALASYNLSYFFVSDLYAPSGCHVRS